MDPITYLRHSNNPQNGENTLRRFGPKSMDHPSIGEECIACGEYFKKGDYTTLVPIGPGADPESQDKALAGRWYNAVAIEVHYACATGDRSIPD